MRMFTKPLHYLLPKTLEKKPFFFFLPFSDIFFLPFFFFFFFTSSIPAFSLYSIAGAGVTEKKIKDEKQEEIEKTDKKTKEKKSEKYNSLVDELTKLGELKEKGLLTEEEFNEQKKKLLKQ